MTLHLSLDALDAGIAVWRQRRWPDDFHNRLYLDLDRHRQEGIAPRWDTYLDILSGWRAFRPQPRAMIAARGASPRQMSHLTTHYDRVRQQHCGTDLTAYTWQEVSGLFRAAAKIKGVSSPVFGSKLSHLLIPHLFPIIDRAATGIPADGYEGYWLRCQTAWSTATCRDELQERLGNMIGEPITPSYPWATKITEICSIGAHATTTRARLRQRRSVRVSL